MHIPPITSDDDPILLQPTIIKDRYLAAIDHLEIAKSLLLSSNTGPCREMEEWRERYQKLVTTQASLRQALDDINVLVQLSVSAMARIPWEYLLPNDIQRLAK